MGGMEYSAEYQRLISFVLIKQTKLYVVQLSDIHLLVFLSIRNSEERMTIDLKNYFYFNKIHYEYL